MNWSKNRIEPERAACHLCDVSIADYHRIEKAILYLETHFQEQPKLTEVARAAGLSEFHFQRTFSRWAGVSPKRFLQYLTAGYARELLRDSRSTLDAAFEGSRTLAASRRLRRRRVLRVATGGSCHDSLAGSRTPHSCV